MKKLKKILAIAMLLFISCSIFVACDNGSPEKIELSDPLETEYYLGDTKVLGTNGCSLIYYKKDGTSTRLSLSNSSISITDFNTNEIGEFNMTITYTTPDGNVLTTLQPYTVEVRPDLELNTVYVASWSETQQKGIVDEALGLGDSHEYYYCYYKFLENNQLEFLYTQTQISTPEEFNLATKQNATWYRTITSNRRFQYNAVTNTTTQASFALYVNLDNTMWISYTCTTADSGDIFEL